jgi:hypothetical protein
VPRIRARLTLTTAALCAALTLAAAATAGGAAAATRAPAPTRTQSAQAPLAGGGKVVAQLTYQATPNLAVNPHLRLSITRKGRRLYDAPVSARACGTFCDLAYGRAVEVLDLLPGGEPNVLVNLYTGGAHCCSVSEIFTYDAATRRYRILTHNFGDPGFRLAHFGPTTVFMTDDDRFAYAFTDYAGSGLPLLILHFNGRALVNVTRQYPRLIAHNAATYLAAYRARARQHWSDSVGVIAAWAADEDELGHASQVARFLHAQAVAGHLNSGIPQLAHGLRFVNELNRFLKKTGYLGGPPPKRLS